MGNCPAPGRPRIPSWVLVALLLYLLGSVPALAQRGAVVQPRNLDDLVAQASLIVHGRVLSARLEPHPQYSNLSTVVVTLRVDETLKGVPAQTLTFRQFVWDIRDKMDAAGYRKGQQLLLLLNPETSIGLRSPVGLEQGRFRIVRDAAGRSLAVNLPHNAALFRDLLPRLQAKGVKLSARLAARVAEPPPGPIALEDLRELILLLAAGR